MQVEKLRSEVNGGSLECEFAFWKAIWEFLREEVREPVGNYLLNLKDQLRLRKWREMGGKQESEGAACWGEPDLTDWG